MRKWGIIITTFYTLVVVCLLLPGAYLLSGGAWDTISGVYCEWLTWIWVAILVGGEAILLSVPVDPSMKRLKPRQHILSSLAFIALLFAILTFAGLVSLLGGIFGDDLFQEPFEPFIDTRTKIMGWCLVLWLVWGLVFSRYTGGTSTLSSRTVGWLLKGSVLELLIAVPAHIIVRNRDDCSAPIVTGFGIATGIAIMLLSFGPSVLILYKKRLEQYKTNKSDSGSNRG